METGSVRSEIKQHLNLSLIRSILSLSLTGDPRYRRVGGGFSHPVTNPNEGSGKQAWE